MSRDGSPLASPDGSENAGIAPQSAGLPPTVIASATGFSVSISA
jgi:hypothetical protein